MVFDRNTERLLDVMELIEIAKTLYRREPTEKRRRQLAMAQRIRERVWRRMKASQKGGAACV